MKESNVIKNLVKLGNEMTNQIEVNGINYNLITYKEAYNKFIKSLGYELSNYNENEISIYFTSDKNAHSSWVIVKKVV